MLFSKYCVAVRLQPSVPIPRYGLLVYLCRGASQQINGETHSSAAISSYCGYSYDTGLRLTNSRIGGHTIKLRTTAYTSQHLSLPKQLTSLFEIRKPVCRRRYLWRMDTDSSNSGCR